MRFRSKLAAPLSPVEGAAVGGAASYTKPYFLFSEDRMIEVDPRIGRDGWPLPPRDLRGGAWATCLDCGLRERYFCPTCPRRAATFERIVREQGTAPRPPTRWRRLLSFLCRLTEPTPHDVTRLMACPRRFEP